jgi:hypothetical protein
MLRVGIAPTGQYPLGGRGRLHETARVAQIADPERAAHDNRLEMLGSHHGADPGTAGRAVPIVDHCRVQAALLGRAPDTGDTDGRVLVAGVEDLVRLPHRLAPDLVRRAQLRVLVLHVQVDRLRGAALEYEHVPAGLLHLGADEATGVGAGDGAGQRALGDHRVTAAGRGHGAGQRAGRHDQLVVRAEGVRRGVDLLDQVLGGQPALAQVLHRPVHVEWLGTAGAGSEIDAQDLALPGHALAPAQLFAKVWAACARMRASPV